MHRGRAYRSRPCLAHQIEAGAPGRTCGRGRQEPRRQDRLRLLTVMAVFLSTGDRDFEDRFAALLAVKRESAADVNAAVAAIIAKVRAEGDAALIELTRRFDGLDLEPAGIRVSPSEIEAARA